MAVEATNIFEDEVYEAADTFKDEFKFSKMDRMIHRFPPELGGIIGSRYVVPVFVAIGPYHHGKKDLEKMEAVKKAAAGFLFRRSPKIGMAVKEAAAYYYPNKRSQDLDAATKKVVGAVDEAHGNYFTEEGMVVMKDDKAKFAAMMLCDACFLLLYMDAYNRSRSPCEDYKVDPSMRRFLFCNRDRINNDIMLLENQLPWRLMQVLIGLDPDLKLKETVQYFIAAMGNEFKIHESSDLQPYVWDDDYNKAPPHLLAHLRCHKTQKPGGSTSVVVDVETNSNHPSNNTLQQPLIQQAPSPSSSTTQAGKKGNPQEAVVVSEISPVQLQEIGIKLAPNTTEAFSDMGLVEGRLFFSSLTLAPLSLSLTDATASWLVNMAAFEVCTASKFTDSSDKTAVCSYLALFAFFMAGSQDVRMLRSMRLLSGPDSDDEMLAFFNTLKKHLPDYGAHFAKVMEDIEKYKHKRWFMTTPYKWVYNHGKTIVAVLSIVIAAMTTIGALINVYKALLSIISNS